MVLSESSPNLYLSRIHLPSIFKLTVVSMFLLSSTRLILGTFASSGGNVKSAEANKIHQILLSNPYLATSHGPDHRTDTHNNTSRFPHPAFSWRSRRCWARCLADQRVAEGILFPAAGGGALGAFGPGGDVALAVIGSGFHHTRCVAHTRNMEQKLEL